MVNRATPLRIPYLTGRCQRLNAIGVHTLAERIRGRIGYGLGIKSGLRRLILRRSPTSRRGPFGAPSRYAEGTWVRVRDEASVRGTLDGRKRLRGLEFTPQLTWTHGRVFRVERSVLRIIDDGGQLRPVSGTVLLAGVDCGGEDGARGCGRNCPMMYRDEWLEPAEAPAFVETGDRPREEARFAHIRSWEEIAETLDVFGLRDGLMFMPEMARYLGQRVRVVRELQHVVEYDRPVETPSPFYLLEGLRCTGDVLGSDGPCHRACSLLWHADWLRLESPPEHSSRCAGGRGRPGPTIRLADSAAGQ
jgi:hypothetical protein